MSKEQRGERKLWYEDGKKSNCDYNKYNDYFINLCLIELKFLLFGNIDTILDGIKEGFMFITGFMFLLLILITAPISVPIRVLMRKRELLYSYGREIDYSYGKDGDK